MSNMKFILKIYEGAQLIARLVEETPNMAEQMRQYYIDAGYFVQIQPIELGE